MRNVKLENRAVLTISNSAWDKHRPKRHAFAAMSLAQTNYGVLWGKEKYYVAVSLRRLGCCLGLHPPLPCRGLCLVLDLPERHPQDEPVVLFPARPLVPTWGGCFTEIAKTDEKRAIGTNRYELIEFLGR
jgi:hypothetical protein